MNNWLAFPFTDKFSTYEKTMRTFYRNLGRDQFAGTRNTLAIRDGINVMSKTE